MKNLIVGFNYPKYNMFVLDSLTHVPFSKKLRVSIEKEIIYGQINL